MPVAARRDATTSMHRQSRTRSHQRLPSRAFGIGGQPSAVAPMADQAERASRRTRATSATPLFDATPPPHRTRAQPCDRTRQSTAEAAPSAAPDAAPSRAAERRRRPRPMIPIAVPASPAKSAPHRPRFSAATSRGQARPPADNADSDDIEIHIGRIEVTAVTPPPAQPPEKPARQVHHLDDYISDGMGGRLSNALGISAVTAYLGVLVVEVFNARMRSTAVFVTAVAPTSFKAISAPPPMPPVTCSCTRSPTMPRAQHGPGVAGADGTTQLKNPPLALDLHYLMTVYGSEDCEAEALLGYAILLFHDYPVRARARSLRRWVTCRLLFTAPARYRFGLRRPALPTRSRCSRSRRQRWAARRSPGCGPR